MKFQFINSKVLENFAFQDFQNKKPFPWHDFESFLLPEAFDTLYREFPSLGVFEYHLNIPRGGQRPHNRYYLAYEKSIYKKQQQGQGLVKKDQLSPVWQTFIDEIETHPVLKEFYQKLFGTAQFHIRYAWHVGIRGGEVSPHRDSDSKVGTHIFYFNTSKDWDLNWGGSILVLGGKKIPANNPDYSDFETATSVPITDNHSFVFKNTLDAWHGVKPLQCPPGHYRRLFNVIFVKESQEKKSAADY